MAVAIPLHGLIDRAQQRLGRFVTYYPSEELVLNGLNPAQTLLCLLDPTLLTRRVAVSLAAGASFIDLRVVMPRQISIQRIVLGDVTADDPTRSLGQVKHLNYTDRVSLSWRRDWWRHTGVPSQWYLHGRALVGLYRRCIDALTLTLIGQVVPTPFEVDTQGAVSELPIALHPLISDLGACLVLIKEGTVEAQRALSTLGTLVGEEHFAPARKALNAVQRQALMNVGAAREPAGAQA